jgi:asparaginyl-tRNA synthetase
MKTIRIVEALKGKVGAGDEVTIKGWVRTRRDSKAGVSFIHINDGSSLDSLQIVAGNDLANYESEVLKLSTGCAVIAKGTLVASPAQGQAVELKPSSLEVIGWIDDPETYPMQPKRHSMEHLRQYAHLRPRTNLIGAIMRVRNTLANAVHRFYQELGFYWIHTPIITANDAEGAGAMFKVSTLDFANLPRTDKNEIDYSQDFFGRPTHLTVSGQLNVECYAMALSKVYTFGPTFRAENSNTRRHLAEFWMIEPEIAFADLNDDADLAESFLKYISRAVLNELPEDMAFFDKFVQKGVVERLEQLTSSKFTRMSYRDAVDTLKKSKQKFEFPVEFGVDLQSEHERFLTENVVKGPVAVMNYPKKIKAFYMRLNEDDETVAAMDVLAPGIGEIIGGSQREERLDVLDRRITEMGLNPKDYYWYRDLRRYGTVPHAGFGLGFERMVQYVTGVENIREVIPFPRAPRTADF